jgi:uncharacterized repeat protein (TIGR03803 family)
MALPGQTLTTLHSFGGADGGNPGGLVQATDGNFYGATQWGGANDNCYLGGLVGCGTVFKITSSGTLTTLYDFCSQYSGGNCTDGSAPVAGLVQATNGDFYGTTASGGLPPLDRAVGAGGTVFKITPSGTLTTLYSFDPDEGGEAPSAALVQATDGNFYGTTSLGGEGGSGTVFKITPSGTLTTLYSFCAQNQLIGEVGLRGCPDGAEPFAGLVQATDGSFYGTTADGGANGAGTIFKITLSEGAGTLTTLYSFCSQGAPYCTDGSAPVAGLVQATNGDFYGTTANGGANNLGTVFKITPSGTLTTLYNFCSRASSQGFARTAAAPRGWSRPPMAICTGLRWPAGPTAAAQPSRLLRVAR